MRVVEGALSGCAPIDPLARICGQRRRAVVILSENSGFSVPGPLPPNYDRVGVSPG